MTRDGEETRAEREADFEAEREELLRDRPELARTARDYLKRNLFDGQAKSTVTSIIAKHEAYGEIGVTDTMWRALAGCVAYIDIRDRDEETEADA